MNLKEALHSNPIFTLVAQTARQMRRETYVVGGYVRDLLLKRPSKDIDFVCVGDGISLAQQVAQNLKSQAGYTTDVTVFKNFGTAMVKHEDYELEFVGARKESYQRNSRKPIVENGTLKDDQNRRDFTINAMAISLNNDSYGELVDPFEGVKDLKRKMIRTPLDPAITFSDDPLRMMRAIRFASQLSFDIAPQTFNALIDHAERLQIVSQERVTTELNKIILSSPPSYGFKLLFHSQLLHQFFPEMVALQGVETIDGKSHKDNFYHTLQVLDNLSQVSDDLWLRWAAILHDIAKPPTKRFHPKAGWTFHGHEDRGARMVPHIFRRLKLPLDQKMKFVQKLVRLHLRPIDLVKKEVTDSAIRRLLYEAGNDIEALMKLCRADITSKNHSRIKRYLANFDLVEQKMQAVEEKDHLRNFQPVISGEDIMLTFGLKPSRVVGDLKNALREAVLDGKIRNERDEAFAYMLQIGASRGLKPVENHSSK
ncbi:MAG: CCA tRNA nucleotidyltransferase [Cyclobacteriaceae bacterium]